MVKHHQDRDKQSVETRRRLEKYRSSAQHKIASVYHTYGADTVSRMIMLSRQLQSIPAWQAKNYTVYHWLHGLGIKWEIVEGITTITYGDRRVKFKDNHWSTGTRSLIGDILDIIGIKLPLGGCRVNPLSFFHLIPGLKEVFLGEGQVVANEVVSDFLLNAFKNGTYGDIPQSRYYKIEMLEGDLARPLTLDMKPEAPEKTHQEYGYQEISEYHTRLTKVSLTVELIGAHRDHDSLFDVIDDVMQGRLDESCVVRLRRELSTEEKKNWRKRYKRIIDDTGRYPTGNNPGDGIRKRQIFKLLKDVSKEFEQSTVGFCASILCSVDMITNRQVY